ncbi:acyltransferase [Oxalobacteraceae bacterium]|nr:acyltransferase [Oxalobacteraceae bacterium]
MTHPPSPRIHGLDTLRALAIALVFMNHYMLFVSGTPTFGWIGELGWTGVDLFFALSGYLIGNQIFAALRSPQGFAPGPFYARRLLRTLPNFYVVLAIYALWPAMRGDSVLPPLWQFLTFTQNLGLNPGTAFSHAWSLCVEEQFYLLLPAVALGFAAWRRSLAWAWAAIAGCVLGGMLVRGYLWTHYVDGNARSTYQFYKLIYYSSLCRFDELLAGVALALLKNYHRGLWTRLTAHGNSMLLAGAGLLGLAWKLFFDDHYGWAMTVFGYPLLGLAFVLLLLAALSPGAVLNRLRIPGAASLALWSYAIYLSHKQVCVLLAQQLVQQGVRPDDWQVLLPSIIASLLAGWLLFRLVETPFMLLRDRWVPARSGRSQMAQAPL